MTWFTVTAPNGVPVQVSGDQLARVRIPAQGETAPAAKAILDFGGGQQQATLEDPDQIMALISGKAAPAKRTARRAK